MNEVLLVGLDLCQDYTQLTCYREKTGEPESVGMQEGEEQYLIPTCLAVKTEGREWVFGEEAERLIAKKEAVSVGNLLQKAEEGEETELYGALFQPEELLEKFLRKVLLLLRSSYPGRQIGCLVVSLEQQNEEKLAKLSERLLMAFRGLGLNSDRVHLQSHLASFLYYTVCQKRELWQNDTALFEFQGGGLVYRQLTIDKKEIPMVATAEERDFSNRLTLEKVKADPEGAAGIFAEIAQTAVYRKILSAIYAVGRGFIGDWSDNVLQSLCIGRRVFKGQNLYAKGACYTACAIATGEESQVLLLGEERLASQVSLPVYAEGGQQEMVLIAPATLWKEAGGEWDFIPDEEKELRFRIRNYSKKEETEHSLFLEGLPDRGRKCTRIRLKLACLDQHRCQVQVKDLGFGEFALPSENQMWETILSI